MTPKKFVEILANVRLPDVFNPYCDLCGAFDRADAAEIRRQNLRTLLEAALDRKAEEIWIGRDLGYRGGRRTGVPLTDESHLELAGHLLGGVELFRATQGPIVSERTATIVWGVLQRIDRPIVLWNVFPFHPHEPNDQFSNRCHSATERKQTLPLLQSLFNMLKPERLIAIGGDARLALKDIELPVCVVRHPSFGGQKDFVSGVLALYGDDRSVRRHV